jgi:hypothetical protein
MSPRPRFILELVPEPSDRPAIIRLRRALKHLLRAEGLRAVKVVEQDVAASPVDPHTEQENHQ